MDGLRVDTVVLRETGARLRMVAEEFATASTHGDEVGDAVGHGGLAGALHEFAHNWDDRRAKMLSGIAALADATAATAATFDHIDAELGRALRGELPAGTPVPVSISPALPPTLAQVAMGPGAAQRPVDWEPLAPADPVPGDPPRVAEAAGHYSAITAAIANAVPKLRAIAADTTMQSEAVSAFRGRTESVADDIAKAQPRYESVARALTAYAPALAESQRLSMVARTTARTAQDDLHRAAVRIAAAQAALVPPEVESPELRSARMLEHDSQLALRAANRTLTEAVRLRDDSARRAERLVNDGRRGDGLGDSWWDNARADVVGMLKTVSTVADWVAVGAGVAALLTAWCPPLSGALGSIATYAAVVSLATKLLLQAMGEDMLVDILISAAAFATLGLSRIALGGARVSVAGANAGARQAAGRAASRSPAIRAADGLPSAPNSMTAIRQMLGGGPVMARNTAREAVQRSMKNRWWLFTSEAGSSVRAFPGQTWDDLAAVRHLDLRNPLQQLRANTFWEPLSLLGSREAAAGMRELDQVHPLIRASEDVMPHLTRLNAQVVGAGGSIAGSSVLTYIETDRLLSDVAGPAERLQLERSASWTSTSQ